MLDLERWEMLELAEVHGFELVTKKPREDGEKVELLEKELAQALRPIPTKI